MRRRCVIDLILSVSLGVACVLSALLVKKTTTACDRYLQRLPDGADRSGEANVQAHGRQNGPVPVRSRHVAATCNSVVTNSSQEKYHRVSTRLASWHKATICRGEAWRETQNK